MLNLLLSVIVCPYLMVLSEPSEVQYAKFRRNQSWSKAKQEDHLSKKWLLSRWILYTGKELYFWVVWCLDVFIESLILNLQLIRLQWTNGISSLVWLVTVLHTSSTAPASAPGRRSWDAFWSLLHWCKTVSAPDVLKCKAFSVSCIIQSSRLSGLLTFTIQLVYVWRWLKANLGNLAQE